MAPVVSDSYQTITHAIRQHATATPGKIAITTGGADISYQQLWRQTVAAARWYRSQAIERGDRVVLAVHDTDYCLPAAYFGLHLAGAVAVPSNARLPADDLIRRIDTLNAKLLVAGAELEDLRGAIASDEDDTDAPFNIAATATHDLADIMFTTGSTGEPKAVVLTHRNISASATLMATFIGNTADDSEVVTLPLAHSFGLGRMRSVLLTGGKVTFVPGLVFPQVAIQAMLEQKATGLSCVPAGIRILLSRSREGLESVAPQIRYIEMGSAPLSEDEKTEISNLFPNTRICMHYGLTEASRSAFLEFHGDKEYLASVGRATPGVEVRITDDDGETLPPTEVGHIEVRGPNVMPCYWKDRDHANPTSDPHWIDTRDLGYLNEKGYLYLSGRADSVINCGGINLLPEDIEAIAERFPGVTDAGCCGVPDPEAVLGEVPRLCVVADSSLDKRQLTEFVQANSAAALPRLIVDRVAELPRTESGKILRHGLKSIDSCS